MVDPVTGQLTRFQLKVGEGETAGALAGMLPVKMAFLRRSLLVTDFSGPIHLLVPEGNTYRAEVFFGGISGDCGSTSQAGTAMADAVDARLHASLASICRGQTLGIAVKHSCELQPPVTTIAFSQQLEHTVGNSQVVKVQRPCLGEECPCRP
jgi:hypothetical protein